MQKCDYPLDLEKCCKMNIWNLIAKIGVDRAENGSSLRYNYGSRADENPQAFDLPAHRRYMKEEPESRHCRGHFRGCQSLLSSTFFTSADANRFSHPRFHFSLPRMPIHSLTHAFWKEDGMMCERAYQQVTGVYCPTEQHAASGLREALLPFHETFKRLKGR